MNWSMDLRKQPDFRNVCCHSSLVQRGGTGVQEEDRELSPGLCSWAAGDTCTEEEMEMEMERGLP